MAAGQHKAAVALCAVALCLVAALCVAVATQPVDSIPCLAQHRITLANGTCGDCQPLFTQDGPTATCLSLAVFPRPGTVDGFNVTRTRPVPALPLRCAANAPHDSISSHPSRSPWQQVVRLGARVLMFFTDRGYIVEFNINTMQQHVVGPDHGGPGVLRNHSVVALRSRYAVVIGGFQPVGGPPVKWLPAETLFSVFDAARMEWIDPCIRFVGGTAAVVAWHGAAVTQVSTSVAYATGGGHGPEMLAPAATNATYKLTLHTERSGGMCIDVEGVPGAGLPTGVLDAAMTTTIINGRVALLLYGGTSVHTEAGHTWSAVSTSAFVAYPDTGRVEWEEIRAVGPSPTSSQLSFVGSPMVALVQDAGHDVMLQFWNWHSRNPAVNVKTSALNLTSATWSPVDTWAVGDLPVTAAARPIQCITAPPPFLAVSDSCNRPLIGGHTAALREMPGGSSCVVHCLTTDGVLTYIPSTHEWKGPVSKSMPQPPNIPVGTNVWTAAVGSNLVASLGEWQFTIFSTISRTWRPVQTCGNCSRAPVQRDLAVMVAVHARSVFALGMHSGVLCRWDGVPGGPMPAEVHMRWSCSSEAANVVGIGSPVHTAMTMLSSQLVLFVVANGWLHMYDLDVSLCQGADCRPWRVVLSAMEPVVDKRVRGISAAPVQASVVVAVSTVNSTELFEFRASLPNARPGTCTNVSACTRASTHSVLLCQHAKRCRWVPRPSKASVDARRHSACCDWSTHHGDCVRVPVFLVHDLPTIRPRANAATA